MWTLDSAAAVAKLEIPGLTGTIDLNLPGSGFLPETINGQDTKNFKSLLAIDLGDASRKVRPTEFFVRGDDLIAVYPESARHIRSQVYWRALPETATTPEFGLEVIASMQTDLLDSDPRFVARSELAAAHVAILDATNPPRFQSLTFTSDPNGIREFRPSPDAVWFTSTGGTLGYLEIPFPGDTNATRLSIAAGPGQESLVRFEHDLLHEFLEKGVIRRCRLRGLFLPARADSTLAHDAVARFQTSELPLTA